MSSLAVRIPTRVTRGHVVAASLAAAAAASLAYVLAPVVLFALVAVAAFAIGIVVPTLGLSLVVIGAVATIFIPHPYALAAVAVLITALLILGGRERAQPAEQRTPRVIAVFVAYLAVSWSVATAQTAYSFEPVQAAALWGLQLSPLLLAFVLTRRPTELSILQWVVVGTAVAVAALQIATPVRPDALETGGIGSSLAMNRNSLGVVFLLALAIVAPRIRLPPRPRDALLIGISIVLVSATAASLSRSSYLAAVSMALAFLLIRGWKLGALVLVAALVLVPLAIGGEVNTLSQAVARFTTTFSSEGLDASSGARLDLWFAAVKAAAENPVFGVGYQQFAVNLPALWEGTVSDLAIASRAGDFAYAHNFYLTILSQGGIVGFLLLLAVIVSCTRDAFRSHGVHRETALLSLIALGAASVFGEPVLVAAVSIPFLLNNALARMTPQLDETPTS